jgi:hypothetical protein
MNRYIALNFGTIDTLRVHSDVASGPERRVKQPYQEDSL